MNTKSMQSEVLKKLQEARLDTPPIQIDKLAEFHGFRLFAQPLTECSGFVIIDEENPTEIHGNTHEKVIIVNSKDTKRRARFTIAHELAHFFLAKDENKNKVFAHRELLNRPYDKEEMEADRYAGQLLAPFSLLDDLVKSIKSDDRYYIVQRIVDCFDISQPAAHVRYSEYLRGV